MDVVILFVVVVAEPLTFVYNIITNNNSEYSLTFKARKVFLNKKKLSILTRIMTSNSCDELRRKYKKRLVIEQLIGGKNEKM